MSEHSDPSSGDQPLDQHVHALRAAYRSGRLVVSADSGTLARARLREAHAIDARDVADAMLRELLRTRKR